MGNLLLDITPNEHTVVSAVMQNEHLTRVQIGKITGWSRPKVVSVLESLFHKHILIEDGEAESSGGRNPSLIGIDPDICRFIGIAIRRNTARILLTDARTLPVRHSVIPFSSKEAPESICDAILAEIMDLLKKDGKNVDSVRGIGIGISSFVDVEKQTVIAPPLIYHWNSFSFKEYMQPFFANADFVTDCVTNMLTYAEYCCREGINCSDMIFLDIGEFIGSGIMANGKMILGSNYTSGNIGHIQVDPEGPECICGQRGCLEAVASAAGMLQAANESANAGESEILTNLMKKNNGVLSFEDFANAARDGDPASIGIIREAGKRIGTVASYAVNILNPRMILLGGYAASVHDVMLSSIKQKVYECSTASATKNLLVEYAQCGENGAEEGAVYMIRDTLFVSVN